MSDTAIIDAYPSPGREGKPVRVSFKLGSGKNKLKKPPKNFSDSDFLLFDFEGNEIGLNKKVRLEGTRLGSLQDNSCVTTIQKIISVN